MGIFYINYPIGQAKTNHSSASDPVELSPVGNYGGGTYAVFWNNETTYVGVGASLNVFDATEPTTPTLLGQTLPLGGVIGDISVISTTAYAAVGLGGLNVLDVSDPTAPTKIGEYSLENGRAKKQQRGKSDPTSSLDPQGCYEPGNFLYQIHGKGTRVFLAYGLMGLRILDMSDPSNPLETGSLESYDGYFETMAVYARGRYAYIVDVDYEYNYSYFRVVDIRDPTKPTVAGLIPLGSITARDVTVDGDYAYIAHHREITIIDVKDPNKPEIAATFSTPGYAKRIMISNGMAFIADSKGVRIIDVADPSNPVEIGFFEDGNRVVNLYIQDQQAYIVDGDGGFSLLDISNPSQPVKVGSYTVAGSTRSVVSDGAYAFLAHGEQGLGVIDVSLPAQVSEVALYQSEDPITVWYVNNDGDLVSMAGTRSTQPKEVMKLVDMSDLSNPQSLGEYSIGEWIYDVYLSGDLAYVAASDAGLRVLDISDPQSPQEISHLDSLSVYAVDVVSDTVYITDREGLSVIDASDPYNLEVRGVYSDPSWFAQDVQVSEQRAYVAYSIEGLRILDVSDPTNPFDIGMYDPEYSNWYEVVLVQISGDRLVIGENIDNDCSDGVMYSFIRMFDVSDPGNLQELSYYQFPGPIVDLFVKDGWIYAAYRGAGMTIFRYIDPAVYPHQVYMPQLVKTWK
jgi:hypothetical protein